MRADDPAAFAAAVADADAHRRRRRHPGCDARRHAVRLPVRAGRRVPFVEIAYIPDDIQAFFDYIKTGASVNTDIPATVAADEVTSWSDEVDVVVIGFGIAGGCAAVSAAAAGAKVLVLERAAAAGGTIVDGRRSLLPRRRDRGPAGHRSRRLAPRRCTSTWSRCPANPSTDKIRAYCDGSVEHFNWLEDLGFQFERSYLPGQGRRPAGHRGPVLHRQRKGVAVLRAGEAGAARPLGAGARRIGRRVDGHRPAAEAGRRPRRADPLRNRGDQPRRRATVRWSVSRWKHFTDTGAIKAECRSSSPPAASR